VIDRRESFVGLGALAVGIGAALYGRSRRRDR
jgi:hypothetical protein